MQWTTREKYETVIRISAQLASKLLSLFLHDKRRSDLSLVHTGIEVEVEVGKKSKSTLLRLLSPATFFHRHGRQKVDGDFLSTSTSTPEWTTH